MSEASQKRQQKRALHPSRGDSGAPNEGQTIRSRADGWYDVNGIFHRTDPKPRSRRDYHRATVIPNRRPCQRWDQLKESYV